MASVKHSIRFAGDDAAQIKIKNFVASKPQKSLFDENKIVTFQI